MPTDTHPLSMLTLIPEHYVVYLSAAEATGGERTDVCSQTPHKGLADWNLSVAVEHVRENGNPDGWDCVIMRQVTEDGDLGEQIGFASFSDDTPEED